MRTSFKVWAFIIGSLLAISLFIPGSELVHANEKWWPWVTGRGEDRLLNMWASVWVGDLGYDSETGRTSSSHWFQIMNHLGFDTDHNYEFQHGVSEVLRRDNRGDIISIRPVDQDTLALPRLSKNGECYWHPDVRGVDCSGENEGEYIIEAYTAVRKEADLNVKMEARLEFWIDAD